MAMEPGAGLDVLIESVVMEKSAGGTPPPYSTVIREARTALESLLSQDWAYEVLATGRGWRCNVFRSGSRRADEGGGADNKIRVSSVSGQSEAHALCMAALDLKLARWAGRPSDRGGQNSV